MIDKFLVRFMKNADRTRNRIIIPQFFINKFGYSYYMEVYEDYIKLIPIKKNKKEEE